MENIEISEQFFHSLKDTCTKIGVPYDEEQLETTILNVFGEYDSIHQMDLEIIQGMRVGLKETETRLQKVNSRLDNVMKETEKFMYFVSKALETEGSIQLTHFMRDGINELVRNRCAKFLENLKYLSGGYDGEF